MTPVAITQLQQAAAQASAHEANVGKHQLDASGYMPASEYPTKRQKEGVDLVGGNKNTFSFFDNPDVPLIHRASLLAWPNHHLPA